jgi:hypothetical protein
MSNLQTSQKAFNNLLSSLKFVETNGVKKAIVGKGAFLVSDDLNTLLTVAAVRKETMVDNGVLFIRRKNSDGTVYFLNNRSDKAFDGWITLSTGAASVGLFDAMTGKVGLAKSRKNTNGMAEVYIQLKPFESIIVQTYRSVKAGPRFSFPQAVGNGVALASNWTIEFVSGGPVLPKKQSLASLGSWTDLDGEEVKNFSGTAKYTTTFTKPSATATNWLLDLGSVKETAEVFLNGKKLSTLIGPSYTVVIPSSDIKANNTLEVHVSNLMANRISYMDRNNMPWKIFYNINMPARRAENAKNGLFDASGWKPLASGLLGPVTLTPLK